jgi:hypothetical protein
MKCQPWIVVLMAIAAASCATAPRPRLGMAVLPASLAPVPATGQRGTPDPLGITVYPRMTFGDGTASVRMRVEPSVLSRSVEVSWWSTDGLGGSHLITLDGDRAARRYDVPIKRLDPGHYEVTAVLMRADGSRIRRSTTILVIGR